MGHPHATQPAGTGRLLSHHYRQRILVLTLAVILCSGLLARVRADDDEFIYRYGKYQEDSGRIGIETHSGNFNVSLTPWLSFRGEVVNDAVSGATPTGLPKSRQLPTNSFASSIWDDSYAFSTMKDNRMGGFGEPTFIWGANRLSLQGSYSGESDYISRGVALNYSRDFNQKNTTLHAGWSHDFDTIEQGHSPYHSLFQNGDRKKDTDEFIVGVNQLLSPKTILTVNLETGYANGYLGDPYKGFLFYDGAGQPESRPGQRVKGIAYVQLTQFVTPLNGSLETSYRFYSDSFGVNAHTASLAWFQKIGKFLVISPSFRYYVQSAADFYHTTLPGYLGPIPTNPGDPTPFDGLIQPVLPRYYSADYRLSNMQTITAGISVNVKVVDHFYIDASYERYVMHGLDNMTPGWEYPNANIFTVGARVTF